MKKIICCLTLIICCLTAIGQDVEIKKKITKIKKSSAYIYAEATLSTKEEAYLFANELLMNKINIWIKKENKFTEAFKFLKKKSSEKEVKQIVIEDINSFYEILEMRRGNSTRVFVFVKKDQIIPIYGDGHVIISNDSIGDGIKSFDRLNQEQPPKVDTLIIIQKDTIRIVEKTKENIQVDKDSVTKDSITNIALKKEIVVVPLEAKKPTVEIDKYSKEKALKSIMNAGNITNIRPIFKNLKAENKIRYNKATDSVSIDPKSYLLIFNKTQKIVAILAPGSTIRKNIFNQKNVQLSDFKNCGAYWFILD